MSTPQHSDLPLPDYDRLTVPAVAQHIRALNVHQLGQLLDYERAHANRPAVTRVMDARLAELRSGAEGSGATPDRGPEWPAPTERRSAGEIPDPRAEGRNAQP